MPRMRFMPRFNRSLERKKRSPRLHAAVMSTVEQIVRDSRHPSLNTHLLDRDERIWEAYVTKSARVTYQRRGDLFIFRNNCRHDIIERRQW